MTPNQRPNPYDDIPTPNRSLFSTSVKWILFLTTLALIFYFFILPLFVAQKLVGRQSQKFDAETSAQVYDNSRQYRQGINRDLARYCRQLAEAPPQSRKAIADLIRTTADTYEGTLTDSNTSCLSSLKD